MEQIFHKAQFRVTTHSKLMLQLKNLYERCDPEEFLNKFALCLRVVLVHGDKLPPVERTLDFAARFSVSLKDKKKGSEENECDNDAEEDEDEEMSEFLRGLFNFLFQNHHCSNQSVRFRVCQFINKLLGNLGDEAFLEDELCNEISDCMMERLQDKSSAVRSQAVMALLRLQDPSNPNCPIIKAFIYHLNMDPSPDVRCAVLTVIGRSNTTLPHILQRIHDVKDTVRRQAYLQISKLNIRSLTIQHRECLLREGLKDRSDIVRECVEQELLPLWLQNFKENYLDFLHALDVENSTETSELALNTLFKSKPHKELMAVLDLEPEIKLIPMDKLSPERSFFWRCLGQFLHNQDDAGELEDYLENIIPDLTPFCGYMKKYLENLNPENKDDSWDHIQHEFVALQLLELAKVFDLSDELGRSNLRQLLLDMLISSHVRVKFIPSIVELLVEVIPDVNTRLQTLAEIVSEIHEPLSEVVTNISPEEIQHREFKLAQLRVQHLELEDDLESAVQQKDFLRAQEINDKLDKLQEDQRQLSTQPEVVTQEVREVRNDPATLSKCLTVVYEMMQSHTVTTLTPQLRSLMDNFVLLCLKIEDALVQTLALQTMAVICLLDKDLAQQYFPMFTLHLANELDEVCIVSLKAMFDILLLYGLKTFSFEEEQNDGKEVEKKKKRLHQFDESSLFDEVSQVNYTSNEDILNNLNLTSVLTSLLDNTAGLVRSTTVEGLCKLFLTGSITSPTLLSRLIILWFNPMTECDSYLRQLLGNFFNMYAINCPLSQDTLEQAFLPTIHTIMDAPHASPLIDVDPDSVARFIVGLTKPGINVHAIQVHNNIAVTLCNELLTDPDSLNAIILLRSLNYLELVLDDPVKQNLQTMTDKMAKIFIDKSNLRYLQKFQQALESNNETSVLPSDDETLANSTVVESLNSTGPSSVKSGKVIHQIQNTRTSSEMDDGDGSYKSVTSMRVNADSTHLSVESDCETQHSMLSTIVNAGSVRSSMSMHNVPHSETRNDRTPVSKSRFELCSRITRSTKKSQTCGKDNDAKSVDETITSETASESVNTDVPSTLTRHLQQIQDTRSYSENDNDGANEDDKCSYNSITSDMAQLSVQSGCEAKNSLSSTVANAGSARSSMNVHDRPSCETDDSKVQRVTRSRNKLFLRSTRGAKALSTLLSLNSSIDSEDSSLSSDSVSCRVEGIVVPETPDSDSSSSVRQTGNTPEENILESESTENGESPVKKRKMTRTSAKKKKSTGCQRKF